MPSDYIFDLSCTVIIVLAFLCHTRNNEKEQLLAFNWRNTMPLSSKENLSKNNKIIIEQVKQHLEKLKEYHIENKLDLPQVFINLFAKHLDAGIP